VGTTRITRAEREDLPHVRALLVAAGLPQEGVEETLETLLVARDAGAVVGCAALEIHGSDGLLRSVCTAPATRGTGLGSRLVEAALERGRERGLRGVYLLTETAADFFPRFGFRRIERDRAPSSVRASREFAALCPASAVAMSLDLNDEERE